MRMHIHGRNNARIVRSFNQLQITIVNYETSERVAKHFINLPEQESAQEEHPEAASESCRFAISQLTSMSILNAGRNASPPLGAAKREDRVDRASIVPTPNLPRAASRSRLCNFESDWCLFTKFH